MDEKDFKKHLQDLAHGHHHPEEHDWDKAGQTPERTPKPAKKTATRKTKRSS